MGLTNYLRNYLLEHIFNKSEYEPSRIYVGLGLGTDGDVIELPETVDRITGPMPTGYDRVETDFMTWTVASAGIVTNRLVITFPEAILAWGTVSTVMLFDSEVPGWDETLITGGLLRLYEIGKGSNPRFPIGELEINLD